MTNGASAKVIEISFDSCIRQCSDSPVKGGRVWGIRGTAINVILSRVRHARLARLLRVDRGAKDKHQDEGCRVPTCLRSTSLLSRSLLLGFSLSLLESSPFFHSLSRLHTRTLLISFSLYFRSSHSPPGYAIRERARGIFASWNAANWPKINTHVEECYPFSLSFALLPRPESHTIIVTLSRRRS